MNPLRRLTGNYLVVNQNRRFEMNICGYLAESKCFGNITTICDISNSSPKVYAVGSTNNFIVFDTITRNLKLVQHERINKPKKAGL